ncbi:MADS-box transcription factor, partial [Striga asiatica]
ARRTIQRYKQFCSEDFSGNDAANREQISQMESLYQDVTKLKAKHESLEVSHRHLLGEDLEQCSLKKLQSLEKQLLRTQSRARQFMTKKMLDQIKTLRKKVRHYSNTFFL